MAVHGLDHINIATPDIDGTARFYRDLLGLELGVPPVLPPGIVARWLVDAAGCPIIHLLEVAEDTPAHSATGAIHHVALKCDDFDELRGRCDAMGLWCTITAFPDAGFRQILTRDPNGVLLEMNFPG